MDIKLLTGDNRQWPATTKSFQQTYLVSKESREGGDRGKEKENEGVERDRVREITHTET